MKQQKNCRDPINRGKFIFILLHNLKNDVGLHEDGRVTAHTFERDCLLDATVCSLMMEEAISTSQMLVN
jgi:hypothetical protein